MREPATLAARHPIIRMARLIPDRYSMLPNQFDPVNKSQQLSRGELERLTEYTRHRTQFYPGRGTMLETQYGVWYTPDSATSQPVQANWARITEKRFPDDWSDNGPLGTIPLYEVNDVDLPVTFEAMHPDIPLPDPPPIVRIFDGAGDYKLMEQQPRWEQVLKVGLPITIDTVQYYPGKLLRYDQETKSFQLRRDILIRVANVG
jgi:hypothetical protein